jgi:YggT family protein
LGGDWEIIGDQGRVPTGPAPSRETAARAAYGSFPPGEFGYTRRRCERRRAQRPHHLTADAMNALLWLIDTVIGIYIFVIFAQVILTWLVHFSVVNTRNQFVYMIGDFLFRLTEPVLRRIRRVMPNLGGIDISPVMLIIGLYFIRILIFDLFRQYA